MTPAPLRLRRFADVEGFVAATADFLRRDEALHVLVGANVDMLRTRPEMVGRRPYLAAVSGGAGVVGVVAMVPPNPLVISPLTPAGALPLVVQDLLDDGRVQQVTDTSGTPQVVEPFAELWRRRTGSAGRTLMHERLYRIDAPPQVADVPGQFRLAGEADLALLMEWSVAFNEEAWRGSHRPDPERLRAGIRARLEGRDGGVGLWLDGEPVSMAAYFGDPPGPARVAPVYTPPALRRHGYGGAVTAAITRAAFQRGHRFGMLFTDVGNATSNHVYMTIGYRPVAEWMHLRFEQEAAAV